MSSQPLKPGVARRYDQLRRRYRRDDTYRALVDMYRNVSFESDVAAHWMAEHDLAKYTQSKRFRPLAAGYEQRELDFLSARGVKLL